MNSMAVRKIIAPLIPYMTVGIALLVFHNALAAILSYHICMVVLILLSRTEFSLKQVLGSRKYWFPVITGLLGAGSGMLLYLIWPLLAVPDSINSYVRSVGLNEQAWPVFIAYFVLVNPWIEEYYWRGYLTSPSRGIVLNDLFFAGYHLIVLAGYMANIWLIALFAGLTAGAWFWRQMNRLNGGLLPSIISHFTADLTVMLVIFYFSTK
jgi:membrane protease YdiL (CAAX protease family)